MTAPPTKPIASLVPWESRLLPPCPFAHEGYYGFNPSIHAEPDGRLLCTVRCADYCRPNSIPKMKQVGRVDTRNIMLVIDPDTLAVLRTITIAERDGLPRAPTPITTGFEDLRLFRTAQDGLMAIATTLQLLNGRGHPEMVLLRFNTDLQISGALPIRGNFPGSWSFYPQKNWSPFDGADTTKFLFSIDRGVLFTRIGPAVTTNDWTPGSLRGGSQLVRLSDGRWLGIGHGVAHRPEGPHTVPSYWHVWHTCDDSGKLLGRSEPMKLSDKEIELAMGLAIDLRRDRAIISYGVEDMEARLGITKLSVILELIK